MKFMHRRWKFALPVVGLTAIGAVVASLALASPSGTTNPIRVAIMTDCKGAFGFGYELDIGGAQAAFYQYAGARPRNRNKPSAGMTGGRAGGRPIQIVGYGCGDDTAATALRETRRLMERLRADIMIGPLSGDEAVAVANYAKAHPSKLFIIGTAGSQDPTLQIAPRNMFRYHGDGAQWNAGIGEIAYKRLRWRRAAIIMDDYSFGWTSAAGMIADFCAIGGRITKRVFPPLNTTDYASYIRQLPRPNQVDGYFWAVGGTGTGASLRAFEQAYGRVNPRQHIGNLFFAFLGNFQSVAPRLVGAYVGGFGTAPGLRTPAARAYENIMKRWHPKLPAADGFVYNYYNAAWALIRGINAARGNLARLRSTMPKSNRSAYEVSDRGTVKLDANRQAIQDQYPLQIVRQGNKLATVVVGQVPNVNQSFGGLFKRTSRPPGRTQPACVRRKLPWQGKIKVVRNGRVTGTILK